jgi:hypothetical protein
VSRLSTLITVRIAPLLRLQGGLLPEGHDGSTHVTTSVGVVRSSVPLSYWSPRG